MPLATNMLAALSRALAATVTLAALSIGYSAALAQDAPVAPEPATPSEPLAPSEPADAAAPRRGADSAKRPIEAVELLITADGPRSKHQGLLARELARQAVLLAARDELGLRTRDRLLRESAGRGSTSGALVLELQLTFSTARDVILEIVRIDGRRRQTLVDFTKRLGEDTRIDYAALAAWCEELSRGEIAAALRTSAASADAAPTGGASPDARVPLAKPVPPAPTAEELPADIPPLLRRMTFASQFAAVRRLHELARRDGPASAASAALARGYANLGVLAELYWHPASVTFKARALLYAQRAVAADGSNADVRARNRRTLGYTLALCGLHRSAIETLALVQAPATDQPPDWAKVAAALCEFDGAALAAVPLDSDAGEIARLCQVLMAEHASTTPEDMEYEASSAAEKRLTAVALELPHCWRVRAAAGRHAFDAGGRATFDAAWYRDIAATPQLAEAAAEIAERQSAAGADLVAEQKSRAELIKTLRAAAADDGHEPSLGALATLVEEASFVDAFEFAQVMVGGYDRDETNKAVKEFRRTVVPIVERHPLYPMLDEWLKMASGTSVDFDADRMLRKIDAATVATSMFELLDYGYREPGEGVAAKLHDAIVAHADETFGDLAALAVRYDVAGKPAFIKKLYETSPHAPQAVAGMIRYHWPAVADQAEAWQRRYSEDQSVLAMLGSRFLAEKRIAEARRCFEAYVKLTTTRQWVSLWGYRRLAETYRAEGDVRRWLATLEEFLRHEGAAQQRGEVQVLIARHYLAEGDYDQALAYAEAVDDYSDAEAQLVVAECREYQHRWLAAEQAYRAVAENDPYGSSVLLWHRYCAQTGYGGVTAARNAVRGFVKSLDEEDYGAAADADVLGGVACFYLLENEPAAAYQWLARAVESGRKQNADGAADPRQELQLVMLADQLGKHDERDAAVARVVRAGEKFVVDGQPRRELIGFAKLLQKMFAAHGDDGGAAFDRAATDELIAAAPAEDQALLAYLAGRMLDKHGQRAKAAEYLRRAVAIPVREASRALAAVLLRRYGIEPNEIAVGPKHRDSRATGG